MPGGGVFLSGGFCVSSSRADGADPTTETGLAITCFESGGDFGRAVDQGVDAPQILGLGLRQRLELR
jgi:hypothetical protein